MIRIFSFDKQHEQHSAVVPPGYVAKRSSQQEQLARIAEISSSQQEHSQEQPAARSSQQYSVKLADIRRLIQQHENIYHAS